MHNHYAPPIEMPQITRLADACLDGACNISGIAISFAESVAEEIPLTQRASHPAVKIIIGQMSFLCNESCGPTQQALTEFREWRAQ